MRAGLEVLTEKGFLASGLDEILKSVGVPKGSFYHYFPSKEAFGLELIERYVEFFSKKILKSLEDSSVSPLTRIVNFTRSAARGMARYDFTRGCLIGNIGQEVSSVPTTFREKLDDGFELWRLHIARCLEEAREMGEIAPDSDCDTLSSVFWIGWEGAVLKAKIVQNDVPLIKFTDFFITSIQKGRADSRQFSAQKESSYV